MNSLETLCIKKGQELLYGGFGDLLQESAIDHPKTIGKYKNDLPLKIEMEFCRYFVALWKECSYTHIVLEERKFCWLVTENDVRTIYAVQAVISENGGSSYSATTAPASYNSKFCTKCDRVIADTSQFCSNCGVRNI